MFKFFKQNKYKVRPSRISKRTLNEAGHKVMTFLFSLSITINLSGVTPKSNTPSQSISIELQHDSTASVNEQSSEPSLSSQISIPENIKPLLPVIKKYSKVYGFDWRLILAVIEQESSFRYDAISPRGAYGLLQIMPETGEELVLNVSHIYDYRTPEQNIIAGIHYLWMQFNRFYSRGMDSLECLKLALAAYNAGPGRVLDAQRLAVYFSENPNKWENVKTFLPLLSRKYYTFHSYVWDSGKPRGGYFENYYETINYVEKIMQNYERYKKYLLS